MRQVCQTLVVSERRACKILGQARATQRRNLSPPSDEKQLTEDIVVLATKYGWYGYRRIKASLNNESHQLWQETETSRYVCVSPNSLGIISIGDAMLIL